MFTRCVTLPLMIAATFMVFSASSNPTTQASGHEENVVSVHTATDTNASEVRHKRDATTIQPTLQGQHVVHKQVGVTQTNTTDNKSTTHAQKKKRGVGVGVSVNPVEVANSIRALVSATGDREGAVKGAAEVAYRAYNCRYNVMVCKMEWANSSGLVGIKQMETFVYNGITFGLWVFEKGTFKNEGDGGYINWAAWGSTGNEGGSMTFGEKGDETTC